MEAHREQAAKARRFGVPVPQPKEALELPPAAEHLWLAFAELASGRQVGFAPSPLSWSDMEAWARLTGRTFSPLEWLLLRRLDLIWLSVHGATTPDGAQPPQGPQ